MCFAKTGEPIEMPFAERTRIGPSNQVLDLRRADPYGTDTSAAAPAEYWDPLRPIAELHQTLFTFFPAQSQQCHKFSAQKPRDEITLRRSGCVGGA